MKTAAKPIDRSTALHELRALVATYLEGSDDAPRATELLDALEVPALPSYEGPRAQKGFAIEFRSGSYFENLDAERGSTLEHAKIWSSREEVESFMAKHEWIMMNGGMVVKVTVNR